MKKCTLCIDRIYNETIAEVDRVPSCVRTCPANARHFGDLGDPASAVSVMVAERGGMDLMPEQGTRPVNKYLPPRPRKPLADSAGVFAAGRKYRRGEGVLRLAGRRAGADLMGPFRSTCLRTCRPFSHASRLSIIVFTTCPASATALRRCSGSACSIRQRSPPRLAYLLALALISGGLMSSTLHLGNPQRAWRALSQWRSSWLSREGVMAIIDLRAAALLGLGVRWSTAAITGAAGPDRRGACHCHRLLHGDDLRVAEIGAGLAHPADAACYLLFAAAGGLLPARPLPRPAAASDLRLLLVADLRFLAAAWTAKIVWWRRLAALRPLVDARNRDRARPHRPRPAARAAACQRELSDPRDGLPRRPQACRKAIASSPLAAGGLVPALVVARLLVAGAGPGWPAALLLCVAALCHLAGVMRRALAVLRPGKARRDELLWRLVGRPCAPEPGADGVEFPALVEPHPLAGILADPAFDDVVQQLRAGLDVDPAVGAARQFELFLHFEPEAFARQPHCSAPGRRRIRTGGRAWAPAGWSRRAGRRKWLCTPSLELLVDQNADIAALFEDPGQRDRGAGPRRQQASHLRACVSKGGSRQCRGCSAAGTSPSHCSPNASPAIGISSKLPRWAVKMMCAFFSAATRS